MTKVIGVLGSGTPMRRAVAFCSVMAFLTVWVPARAQRGAAGQAAAEALFQQGVELMQEERYTEACEKFAGSQSLDPALGTLLRLADCYDRARKTASAWALFEEAKALAEREHQPDRARIAAERARDLEARLSRVRFDVAEQPGGAVVEIVFNDVAVPPATWETPLPVDPGAGRVRASAPGFQPWHRIVEVADGPSELTVQVPALVAEPEPAPPRGTELAHTDPVAEPQSSRLAASGTAERAIGFVLGGVGAAGLVAGGVLALRARSLNEDSLRECRAEDVTACTPRGVELRDDAQRHADMATVFAIAGGALASVGFVLVLAAPSTEHRRSGIERIEVRPGVAPGVAGVKMTSVWW
jgi:hypothetical protein